MKRIIKPSAWEVSRLEIIRKSPPRLSFQTKTINSLWSDRRGEKNKTWSPSQSEMIKIPTNTPHSSLVPGPDTTKATDEPWSHGATLRIFLVLQVWSWVIASSVLLQIQLPLMRWVTVSTWSPLITHKVPGKYLSNIFINKLFSDKKYCLWEPWLGLRIKLIKRHTSDQWSHLWREGGRDSQTSPCLLPSLPQITICSKFHVKSPEVGGGISLAQTFLALLNNIPVNPFHTKQKTMNEWNVWFA